MQPSAEVAGPDERRVSTPIAVTLLVLSLAVAASAVVAVSLRSPDPAPTAANPAAPTFLSVLPPELAGLPGTAHLTGSEAVEAVTGLHVGDVPVDMAEVARYGGGRIVVWVSWSAREPAGGLVERMTERIAEGGTPFSSPKAARGLEGLYVTEGNGQIHYYWAHDGGVWWLAADRGLARPAVVELRGVSA